MGEVIDLAMLAREAKQAGPSMARGVDLSVVRNKRHHQHHFVLAMNFTVADDIMAKIAERMLMVNGLREKAAIMGRELGEDELPPNVPIPTGEDNVMTIDGPGCIKCGMHWAAAEGYGQLCPVSDVEFAKKLGAMGGMA